MARRNCLSSSVSVEGALSFGSDGSGGRRSAFSCCRRARLLAALPPPGSKGWTAGDDFIITSSPLEVRIEVVVRSEISEVKEGRFKPVPGDGGPTILGMEADMGSSKSFSDTSGSTGVGAGGGCDGGLDLGDPGIPRRC